MDDDEGAEVYVAYWLGVLWSLCLLVLVALYIPVFLALRLVSLPFVRLNKFRRK